VTDGTDGYPWLTWHPIRTLAPPTPATDDELLEAKLTRLTRRQDAADADHRLLVDLYLGPG